MSILITGGEGTMGLALAKRWPNAVVLGHRYLDVTDEREVNDLFHAYSPSVVVHAAAVTDHQCPDLSRVFRTNVIGTQIVLDACQKYCAEPVYLSTHYVYPGTEGLYRESDPPDPIGFYAWSKYLGERTAAERGALIIRGSWYTPEKLERWSAQGAVSDAWCSRTSVSVAAEQIAQLVERQATGIYNIGGARRTFAEIAELEGVKYRPTNRADLSMHLPYTFPKDSSVHTGRYEALVNS